MVAQNILRTYEVKSVKKFGYDELFDVTQCLEQIEIPDLFHMCAPCSKHLIISTMALPMLCTVKKSVSNVKLWTFIYIYIYK